MRTLNRFSLLCFLFWWIFIPVQSSTATTGFSEMTHGLSEHDRQAIQALLPLEEQAILRASNAGRNDYFGSSVAVEGDTVVIGSPGAEGPMGTPINTGAAYVFTRDGTGWREETIIRTSEPWSGDSFGIAVDISGNTIIVGAHTKGINGFVQAGAAFIFEREGDVWIEKALLRADDPRNEDYFGWSVAIFGDIAVVGISRDDGPLKNSVNIGGAYIYARENGTWVKQTILRASNAEAGDEFGWSVAINGTTILVGAIYEDGINNTLGASGAAYVFVWNGMDWSEQAILRSSNPGTTDQFGYSVAIDENTAVVGMNYNVNPDKVSVFVRDNSNWSEQAILSRSVTSSSNRFGQSISISGNRVVVSSASDHTIASYAGAIYIYVREGTTWTQQSILYSSNLEPNDSFGWSTALSDDLLVVGARWEDGPENTIQNTGAAYLFEPQISNQAPLALAGADQSVTTLSTVTLNGSGTDPDNDELNYGWSQTGGPAVILNNPITTTTTFMAPDDPAVLSFTLTLTDTFGLTATDEVVITVENQAPTAYAGEDQIVKTKQQVFLAGNGNDPDNDELSYLWVQTHGVNVALDDATSSTPSLITPDQPTSLIFQLIITDDFGATATDSVMIDVTNYRVFLPVVYETCELPYVCR